MDRFERSLLAALAIVIVAGTVSAYSKQDAAVPGQEQGEAATTAPEAGIGAPSAARAVRLSTTTGSFSVNVRATSAPDGSSSSQDLVIELQLAPEPSAEQLLQLRRHSYVVDDEGNKHRPSLGHPDTSDEPTVLAFRLPEETVARSFVAWLEPGNPDSRGIWTL
jgi:hypothetical protein